MRAILVLAGLVAAMSLVLAADGGGGRQKPQPKPGTLVATGAGVVEGRIMAGTLEIAVADGGEVELRVPATATVEADKGTKEDAPAPAGGRGADGAKARGAVIYKGFSKAVITGEAGYRIAGKGLTITAKGAGQAFLLGEGTYNLVKLDEQPDVKVDGAWFVKPAAGGDGAAKPARPEAVIYGEFGKRGGGDNGGAAADPGKPKNGRGDKGNKPAETTAPKTEGEGA